MSVRTFIAVMVTLVWVAIYVASIVNTNFHPPLEVNAVMLLVAGYFFGSGIRKGVKSDESNSSRDLP